MGETKTVCSNCDERTSDHAIFCGNCGHNLHLPKKIESIDEISYKDNIEEDFLTQYLEIDRKIKDFDGFEIELNQQNEHLEFLYGELKRETNTLKMLEEQVKSEKEDVDKLKNKKWSNLVAKIRRDFDSLLEKEEQEYFDALHRLESAQMIVEELKSKIRVAANQKQEIVTILETKKSLKTQQKEIIYTAAEGIKDDEEDRIELELSKLTQRMEPYLLQKSKLQTANSFIIQALEFLSMAKEIIETNDSEAKKMTGNGLLSESIKKSLMADIRNLIGLTKQMLNEAENFIKQTKFTKDIEPLQGTEFWEEFLKQFIEDLSRGEKVIKSTDIINKAISQCNQIGSWLKSQISHMTLEVENILKEIDQLQEELLEQRTRIMKNALENKNSKPKKKTRKPSKKGKTRTKKK